MRRFLALVLTIGLIASNQANVPADAGDQRMALDPKIKAAQLEKGIYRSSVWEQYLLEGEAALQEELKDRPVTYRAASNAEKLLLLALKEAKKLGPSNVKMVRPLEDLAQLYAHEGSLSESDKVSNQALAIRQMPGAHQKTFEALASNASRDPSYWDLKQFKQLVALVPELDRPRLGGQPPAGQDLWEQGKMLVHKDASNTLEGDFNNDGQPEIALLLDVGGFDEYGKGALHYLLIANQNQGRWHRLVLQGLNNQLQQLDDDKLYASGQDHRLYNGELIKHKPCGLIFDAKRRIIGISTGETQRLTKSASMTTRFLPNGQHKVSQEFGYVLEKQLILAFRWQQASKTFRLEAPCWFLDAESEDALRTNGINPESEREFFRVPKSG